MFDLWDTQPRTVVVELNDATVERVARALRWRAVDVGPLPQGESGEYWMRQARNLLSAIAKGGS